MPQMLANMVYYSPLQEKQQEKELEGTSTSKDLGAQSEFSHVEVFRNMPVLCRISLDFHSSTFPSIFARVFIKLLI